MTYKCPDCGHGINFNHQGCRINGVANIYRPANDDVPTDAWIEFRGSKDFLVYAKEFKALCWAQKTRRCHDKEKDERSAANFIWFMKFELGYSSTKINTKPELTVIERYAHDE